MIELDFSSCAIKTRKTGETAQVFDPVRKKWLVLTPEEHVRQYLLQYLTGVLQYPLSLTAVEKNIKVGNMNKRFDIVVYNRDHQPWLLAECKAPDVPVSQATLLQLLNYQRTVQCSYWLLSNGYQTFCANATDINNIVWMNSLPGYGL